ncbi:T9SS C-terminal target domain-containing protein [Marixanthomonas ophiurae]|uniref:T9SS C-terminal target domain-containing protein n=2 Tax=Marixanthomonas ophiurae TaxID=387659 RepID=A0A3E1QDD1_9FLAO|nr:T9SS C-terminal target domain-containing protein [Marixanthomonas ophiurae]
MNAQTDKSSINDLLNRYSQLETQSGSISEHFTKEEQRMLRTYFMNQQPARAANGVEGVSLDNSEEARQLITSEAQQIAHKYQSIPLFEPSANKDSSEEARKISVSLENRANAKQQNPLFVTSRALTINYEMPPGTRNFSDFVATESTQTINLPEGTASVVTGQRNPSAVIAYSDRTVFEGDYSGTLVNEDFAGGPGATAIQLCGDIVSSDGGGCFPAGELEDGFNITASNDGPDNGVIYIGAGAIGNTSTLMGANSFADFTLLNFAPDGAYAIGADLFVDSVSNAEIRVYDTAGVLVETFTITNTPNTENFVGIISDDPIGHVEYEAEADAGELFGNFVFGTDANGGGGGGTACSQEHPYAAGTYAGVGSSIDSDFKTAVDIQVAMGEDFTLESIEVPFLTFAPEDAPVAANVVYYEDDGGLPGAMIGSETVVPTVLSSAPWINPIAFEFFTSLPITPFTFEGDASSDTTYWVEISMGTATNQPTVFWEGTLDTPVEGEPAAQFDGTLGTWSVPDPLQETIYTFDGNCEPMGGGGVACSEEHPYAAGTYAGVGSSVDSDFKTAVDIDVAMGEDFTLEAIEVPFLTFAPEDPPTTANVVYYEDAGGLPGAMIGSETVVPTVLSSAPWINPIAFEFFTSLPITPFTFEGDASSDTTYWVEISMGTATNQPTVFWEGTLDTPVEGEPAAQFDGTLGTWSVPDPLQETIYTFDGTCTPMGGGGPGPLTTVYGVNNANQDLIGFGTATPGDTEVFGTSLVTANFENAGAIDPANPTTGYVLDNGGDFYSFDVTTGIYTSLGNIPGDWVGMEYNLATGDLYAIAGTDLYTIDPAGLSATLVGSLGLATGALPVALAIDGAGVGYTYDIVDDSLYSVDLATGTATLVGPIGFDANFGQGMAYDPTTDVVYMAAFNGGAFAAEWRSVDTTTGSTTLIGAIVTDDPDPQVAWASVGETLPPPACPEPLNLAVTVVGPTSADLSWDAEPNASSGYIWYVFDQGANPATDTPVETGTTPSGTTTATATALSGGLSYDFYVVADCSGDGLSKFAGPITFATPPACGGKFYDNGGLDGDYANDSDDTVTINPENSGELVTVTFTSFDVEEAWDALYVYDGPDTTFPLIDSGNPATNSGFPAGGYYGTTPPGPFTSSDASGALTFVFLSDGSVPRPGWEADVVCAIPPPPNDMIANSIDVDEIGFPYTDPAVQMQVATTEDGNPTGCNIDGANGVWYNFVPNGDGDVTASITSPAGASVVTFFEASDENASETDLTLVNQGTNQCLPGTSTTINTTAGQAYYVFVVNTGGPTDITIDGTNLGTEDNAIEGFSYYPNPADSSLTLRAIDTIENVAIYSILGQKVIDQTIGNVSTELNISALSTGTYIMKVSVNGEIGTYKVIKR